MHTKKMGETYDETAAKSGEQRPFRLKPSPCNYCKEFFRAVLKCLGFESRPRSSPPPPADPPAMAITMRSARRAPPQPPIGGGRGSQNNSRPAA
ncbi:Unknown protein [Striga hermonthica]|uniref:Uncharacterized protein n=1 Tax=Striga hermonthica TaxID=68872 RepID=A0A9N7NCS4_STRHE|nr:Unknown protein [Striga hermonthica]